MMVGKVGKRIEIYRKLCGEEQVNVPNQMQGEVWNTLTGGGTGTASEVFQMFPSTFPRPMMTLEMSDPCK